MSGTSAEPAEPFYRFDGLESESFEPRLFDLSWLRDNNLVKRENTQGRGCTAHIQYVDQALVLRRYYRGGAVRHLSQDQYVWNGLERTRPFAEYNLLLEMTRLGLPCPKPYACQVVRSGLFYRGALIMHEIQRTATLADILFKRVLTNDEWVALGVCLRRFHDASVFHSDLNANNVLLNDKGEVFLIDFDRSRFRSGHGRLWKIATLKRLQRSILKCQAKSDTFYYSPAGWDALHDGYLSQQT